MVFIVHWEAWGHWSSLRMTGRVTNAGYETYDSNTATTTPYVTDDFESYQLANCWKGRRKRTRTCQKVDETNSPLIQIDGDPDCPDDPVGDYEEEIKTELDTDELSSCGTLLTLINLMTHNYDAL